MNRLDDLAANFAAEIIGFLHNWMKLEGASDLQFHEYRMKLLSSVSQTGVTVSDRLNALLRQLSSKYSFEVREVISDKVMGETTSRYIFAKIIGFLNAEYLRMLDKETEMMESENDLLENKTLKLAERLGLH